MVDVTSIFGTQNHVTVAQECARAALILVYGLVLVRVSGRRIFGRWAALDIIVSVVAGSSLSRALTGSAPLAGTLAATFVLVMLHAILCKLVARWALLSHLVEGIAVDIGRDGKLFEDERLRHSLSEADLNEALRSAHVENVSATRKVVLEPSGAVSVLPETDR